MAKNKQRKPFNTNIKDNKYRVKNDNVLRETPGFAKKNGTFNSNDRGLCRISGMSFGCFSHILRKNKRRMTCKHTFFRVKMTYYTTYIS